MFLTLLKTMGAAGSFLNLCIYVAVIFGIPLVLLALRVIEIIADRRYEMKTSRTRQELGDDFDDQTFNDALPKGRIVSTSDLKNA